MTWLVDILKLCPTWAQIAVIALVVGVGGAWAHEARYMTVDQYTKSYVLDLKSEIRQIEKDLGRESISEDAKEILREQLEFMLDELCYEVPDDPYCKRRG